MKVVKNLIAGLMGAGPCWMMVWMFVRTWQAPMDVEGGRWVKMAIGIMVLELILVHSGALFGVFTKFAVKQSFGKGRKIGITAGMVGFYMLFAWAFAIIFDIWSLFWIYCWVTGSRLLTLYRDVTENSRMMIDRSGISILLYIVCAVLSAAVKIPPNGLTQEVLAIVYPGRGSGLWEQNPQQALLAGSVYFGLLGLWELVASFLPEKQPESGR